MNNLWKKLPAILLSAAMLLTSFAAFAAEEADTETVKSAVSESVESYLKGFGIFGEAEVIDNSEITRVQAADYFVKAAGFDYSRLTEKLQVLSM